MLSGRVDEVLEHVCGCLAVQRPDVLRCLRLSAGIGAAGSASYHSCLVEYPHVGWQVGQGVTSRGEERNAGGLVSENQHQV